MLSSSGHHGRAINLNGTSGGTLTVAAGATQAVAPAGRRGRAIVRCVVNNLTGGTARLDLCQSGSGSGYSLDILENPPRETAVYFMDGLQLRAFGTGGSADVTWWLEYLN